MRRLRVLHITVQEGTLYKVVVRKTGVDGIIENGTEHNRNAGGKFFSGMISKLLLHSEEKLMQAKKIQRRVK